MRGALVIALCATGCFSDHGVALEVNVGDTGATWVKLFIGKTACTAETAPMGVKCGGIAPMGVTNLLPGDVFFRDAPSDDKAMVTGHTVTFQLKADKATWLPIVIAVGFDQNMVAVGTATLTNLEVPSNSARIATTTLVKANTPGSAELVKVWDSSTTSMTSTTSTSSCVAVQHAPPNWQFVVPADDPDCDGLPNKTDCNANAYLGSSAGQARMPNCFGKDPSGSCMLGSLGCIDGSPMSQTCAAQSPQHDMEQVCVPSQFCSACTGLDPQCPQNLIDPFTNPVPRIDCHVPTDLMGNPCPGPNSMQISVDDLYPANQQCDQPQIGAFLFTTLPTSSTHTFGGVTVALENIKAPCNFMITWTSGSRSPPDTALDHGMIQLQTGDRITLVPVVFRFSAGVCSGTEQFGCSVTGNSLMSDPLMTCARQQ